MNAHQRRIARRIFVRKYARALHPPPWVITDLKPLPDGTYAYTATRSGPPRAFTPEMFNSGVRYALASPYAIPGYG